jgi:stage III sporulation protein SpoIIIAA
MLFKRIALVTLAGVGITASSAIAIDRLNRSLPAEPIAQQQPTAPRGMMDGGMMSHVESIPPEWIDAIARKEDIVALATRLESAIYR